LEAAVFTVNSTGDAPDEALADGICEATDGVGDCTLRAAIAQSVASAGPDEIHFNLAGTAPFVIQPAVELMDSLPSDLVIDATTQPGFSGAPLVVVDGAYIVNNGFWLNSSVVLKGLVIQRFISMGVRMVGNDNAVEGCYIGTNAGGTAAAANYEGILVGGNGNRIGGSLPGQGNVISGNAIGIEINAGDGNFVFGNKIGTNAAASAALPNSTGIMLSGAATSNHIGGALPGQGNTISGNQYHGIYFYNFADYNYVQGNRIGSDASGNVDIPNGTQQPGDAGVSLSGAVNTIGGVTREEGNLITYNQGDGIACNLCGSPAIKSNTIALNSGIGIRIDSGTAGAEMRQNEIYGNGGLGIDIGADGVTANDSTETDGIQNYPVLLSATTNGCGESRVTGSLQSYSSVGTTYFYMLEIFQSSEADPLGFGEGETFVSGFDLDLDDNGFATFDHTLPSTPNLSAGDILTATATEPYGNTSEFSQAILVSRSDDPGDVSFSVNEVSTIESAGQIMLEIQRTCGQFGEGSVTISTSDVSARSGEDYTAISSTVSFADGETSKKVAIPILEDALTEDSEMLTVALSNAVGVSLGTQSQIVITISDNDTVNEDPPLDAGGSTGSGTTGGGVTPAKAGEAAGCGLVPPGALESGPNDARISFMGPDGDVEYGGYAPAVAYNEHDREFFVIWAGNDDSGTLDPGELEIYGQRVDAVTGGLLGARVRLSDAGTDGSPLRNVVVGQGMAPSITYDSSKNEYLAVWASKDDFLADNEIEIFGQRIDAATGVEIGENDFQISRMGPNGDSSYIAYFPGVAYNGKGDEYLVIWAGIAPGQAANAETELYGQRIASNGGLIGGNVVLRAPDPASEEAGNGFVIYSPEVAYNFQNDEYLIVFNADLFSDNDVDIFAQRVDGATASPIGVEFRVSDMGTAANPGEPFGAVFAHAAYDQRNNAYLVVWQGSDTVDKEFDIYGQFLDAATGAEIGADDFQISSMGPIGSIDFGALGFVDVAYNSKNGEYEAVWNGDHDQGGLIDDELEIFSQRIDAATGVLIGSMERLSDLQGTGNISGRAGYVAIAYNPSAQAYLAVWEGDDDVPPLVDGETEILGQLLTDVKCGNGVTEGAEGCDDGNVLDSDGCSASCAVEESATTGGTSGGTTGDSGSLQTSGGCSLIR